MSQSIPLLLEEQTKRTPQAIAIRAPGRPGLSYTRLLEHTRSTVRTMLAGGLEPHSRVAIVLPNGAEMATAFLAIEIFATAAPLNPAFTGEEFAFYLSDLKVEGLLVQAGDDTPARDAALSRGIPILELLPSESGEAGIFRLIPNSNTRGGEIPCAQSDDTAIVLHTSGTTSRPKIVPLTQANICRSAQNIRESLDLVPEDCCLNVMPLFHIHGLMASLLASLSAGASVVCAPGFQAPKFFEWFQECRPSWFTAVPTMHQAILRRAQLNPEVLEDSHLRFIRSCSSALHPRLMTELEKSFQVPVIEAYGMTEASHQMASNPLPPAVRKPGSVGIATGTKLAVMNETDALLAPGEIGEIVIRGESVMGGYEENPAANQSAFSNGWFRTGDEGYLDQDQYLFITGRLKEIINRGGEKISPREVDEVLMDHRHVDQAVAFAVPDPQLGEEIAAAVVLRAGGSAVERDLQNFVGERLSSHKVPRRILFVDRIPKGPTGKLQRLGLADVLGLTGLRSSSQEPVVYRAPETELERVLVSIWIEVLGVKEVGISDQFLDLGGDSVLAAQITARIRSRLQLEVSPSDFFESPTVAAMARILEAKLAQRTNDGKP